MTLGKSLLVSVALLMLGGCSSKGHESKSNEAAHEISSPQLTPANLQGEWMLDSYRLDCESTKFEPENNYRLTFNEADSSFGMTTDCNLIGGMFEVANDTIRFKNIFVTEMACDKMTVEENMLRLLNDTTSYAICNGDTMLYTAPAIGNATLIKR